MVKKNCLSGGLNPKGFTLIELLVVVLIIGILAAVALPQYQKAVKKSRITQALTTLAAVGKAEQIYYLANGSYTGDFSLLDIEAGSLNSTDWDGWSVDGSGDGTQVQIRAKFLPNQTWFIYQIAEDKIYCSQCCTAKTERVCQKYFGDRGMRVDPTASSYDMYPVIQ